MSIYFCYFFFFVSYCEHTQYINYFLNFSLLNVLSDAYRIHFKYNIFSLTTEFVYPKENLKQHLWNLFPNSFFNPCVFCCFYFILCVCLYTQTCCRKEPCVDLSTCESLARSSIRTNFETKVFFASQSWHEFQWSRYERFLRADESFLCAWNKQGGQELSLRMSDLYYVCYTNLFSLPFPLIYFLFVRLSFS